MKFRRTLRTVVAAAVAASMLGVSSVCFAQEDISVSFIDPVEHTIDINGSGRLTADTQSYADYAVYGKNNVYQENGIISIEPKWSYYKDGKETTDSEGAEKYYNGTSFSGWIKMNHNNRPGYSSNRMKVEFDYMMNDIRDLFWDDTNKTTVSFDAKNNYLAQFRFLAFKNSPVSSNAHQPWLQVFRVGEQKKGDTNIFSCFVYDPNNASTYSSSSDGAAPDKDTAYYFGSWYSATIAVDLEAGILEYMVKVKAPGEDGISCGEAEGDVKMFHRFTINASDTLGKATLICPFGNQLESNGTNAIINLSGFKYTTERIAYKDVAVSETEDTITAQASVGANIKGASAGGVSFPSSIDSPFLVGAVYDSRGRLTAIKAGTVEGGMSVPESTTAGTGFKKIKLELPRPSSEYTVKAYLVNNLTDMYIYKTAQ